MRVLTFSTKFPATHPRKGEPTYFVEKIWKCLWDMESTMYNPLDGYWQKYDSAFPVMFSREENIHEHLPKVHTIRAGNRWKVGEWFSPRIWTGAPYYSKQLQFAPPIQIKKIWNFEMDLMGVYSINGKYFMEDEECEMLARNDGLSVGDMMYWFMPNLNKPKEFKGQILSWSDQIEY